MLAFSRVEVRVRLFVGIIVIRAIVPLHTR